MSSATEKTLLENFYIEQVKGFWLPLKPLHGLHDYYFIFKPTYRPDIQAISTRATEDEIGMAQIG